MLPVTRQAVRSLARIHGKSQNIDFMWTTIGNTKYSTTHHYITPQNVVHLLKNTSRLIIYWYFVGASLSQAYHHDSHHQGPTLNDLPSPQIPWEEWNSKRQRKNNLVLITGIVFLGLTFGVVSILSNHLLSNTLFFMHWWTILGKRNRPSTLELFTTKIHLNYSNLIYYKRNPCSKSIMFRTT